MDDKRPPPAYSPGEKLSTSSRDYTLSISPGPFYPGSNLRLTLSASDHTLASAVGDAECSLEGRSQVELMGKRRYQKAMLVNASLGTNGAAMVTSRETHIFSRSTWSFPLVKTKDSGSIESQVVIPREKSCSCPGSDSEGVLPSFQGGGDGGDESRVEWELGVRVRRKGVLKRDVKLSISIPVSMLPPSTPQFPLAQSSAVPFNYTSSSTSSTSPGLTASLSLAPSNSSPDSIAFTLTLSAPEPFLPALTDIPASENFGISVALTRAAWTKGIEQESFGDPGGFDWAERRVGAVTFSLAKDLPAVSGGNTANEKEGLKRDEGRVESRHGWTRPIGSVDKGEMAFQGQYRCPEEAVSVKGCNVAINWAVLAVVSWSRLSKSLEVGIPVIMPMNQT